MSAHAQMMNQWDTHAPGGTNHPGEYTRRGRLTANHVPYHLNGSSAGHSHRQGRHEALEEQ